MKLLLLSFLYSINLIGAGNPVKDSNHAIYVSVLEVTAGSLMVKVFANDLEDAIYNQSQQRFNLLSGDCHENKVRIKDYFASHLSCKIDGKLMRYNFVSCEVNDISLWIKFDFTPPPIWSEVEITADYLMELFPTQSNVVSITYHGEKRMFRLTNELQKETISF